MESHELEKLADLLDEIDFKMQDARGSTKVAEDMARIDPMSVGVELDSTSGMGRERIKDLTDIRGYILKTFPEVTPEYNLRHPNHPPITQ